MPVSVLLIDANAQHAQQLQSALAQDGLGWQVECVAQLGQAQALLQATPQRWDAALAVVPVPGADWQPRAWMAVLQGLPAMALLAPTQELLAAPALRAGFGDYALCDAAGAYLQQLPAQIEDLLVRAVGERARRDIEAELDRTSALLAQKTRELEITLASVTQAIMKVDAQGRICVHNQRLLQLLDLPAALLQGQPQFDAVIAFQLARGDFGADASLVEPVGRDYILGHATPGGAPLPPECYLRRTPAGRHLEVRTQLLAEGGHVRTFTDVTEYLALQEALRTNEARWRSLTALSSDWFWEQDAQLRFTRFDGTPDSRHGGDVQQFIGKCRWELPCEGVTPAQWAAHRAQLEARQVFFDFELQRTLPDGAVLWAAVSGEPVFDDAGEFTGYRGVARDITAQKRAQAEIARLAFYDELTGLPNRRLLQDRLEQAQLQSARDGRQGALLFLDLDNFKAINDSLGHDWGDALLQQVAQRLGRCVRASDTVARLGGDEFIIVLPGLHVDAARAAAMAEVVALKILSALAQPYTLGSGAQHSTPSLGIALFQGQGQPVSALLQQADLAMYQAKASGRNTFCFFDAAMQAQASARAALEADMRLGLERGEFLLHYQRVVDGQGVVLGAEALVRWQHPQRGLVLPGEFIALAEQTGLILPLGQRVLRLACEQQVRWQAKAPCSDWVLAVNVSAQEFRHPGFVAQVLTTLAQTGADAGRLKLELTESLLLHDVQDSIAKMQALRARGLRFALDDFGTGYSSLAYLKRLPLDQLKIDQSFVRDLMTDANDAAIACTVLGLGRSLGLEVLAEGVETSAQRKFLLRHGCQRFQGYWFGRPGPPEQLLD